MSGMFVVAVKDRAIDAFMPPFCVPALNAGIRAFQDEINRSDSPMNAHPDDYDLYWLGMFHTGTGAIESRDAPEQIAIGKSFVKRGA